MILFTLSMLWSSLYNSHRISLCIAQKMKFSIKDFLSKCDQIHKYLRIWSHLLKKSLMDWPPSVWPCVLWHILRKTAIRCDVYFLKSNTLSEKMRILESPNTGKYGPELTPYLDTFHALHFLKGFNFNGSKIIRG